MPSWVFQRGEDWEADYWAEEAEFDRWLASGKSVEEWLGKSPAPPAKPDAPSKPEPAVPRIAFTREEAAQALGISVDHFDRHVKPEIRVIQTGARMLIPAREVEHWAQNSAARALKD